METEDWVRRKQRLAPRCRYRQCVFTMPKQFHIFWLYNRALFVNLFFGSAWRVLRSFFLDPKQLGAMPAAVGVFQSWGDTLYDHLHLHFLVTDGGLSARGDWVAKERHRLFDVWDVCREFRQTFCDDLEQAFAPYTTRGNRKPKDKILHPPPAMSVEQCQNLIDKFRRKKWSMRIQPPMDYADAMIKYLAFYIRRGPISERRILEYDGQRVRIKHKHPEKHSKPTFDLPADELVRRLLLHVPERGVHVVRSFGLFHHAHRNDLARVHMLLGQPPLEIAETEEESAESLCHELFPDWDGNLCPKCGRLLVVTAIDRPAHSPPERKAA
jgi:hypothetical protein